jgi:hypothetical protein
VSGCSQCREKDPARKRGNSPDVNLMPGKTGAPSASDCSSPRAANAEIPLGEARVDLPQK